MATQVNRGLAFATRIDIPEALRLKLVELLNAHLSDAFDLYAQLRQGHGNVKSTDFIQLHELYDAIAESVLKREVQPASRPIGATERTP